MKFATTILGLFLGLTATSLAPPVDAPIDENDLTWALPADPWREQYDHQFHAKGSSQFTLTVYSEENCQGSSLVRHIPHDSCVSFIDHPFKSYMWWKRDHDYWGQEMHLHTNTDCTFDEAEQTGRVSCATGGNKALSQDECYPTDTTVGETRSVVSRSRNRCDPYFINPEERLDNKDS